MSDAADLQNEAEATSSTTFTEGEQKFVLAVLKNMKGGLSIEFDAEAVAQELGMKDGTSARSRWNTIKRTKIAAGPAGGVDKTSPAKKNTTPKKATSDGTPKKRGRPSKAVKAAAEAAQAIEDNSDEVDSVVDEAAQEAVKEETDEV